MKTTWAELKNFSDSNVIRLRYLENNESYIILASDKNLVYETQLFKNASDTTDLNDFVNNYKNRSNPTILENRFYSEVSAYTTITSDYIISSGVKFSINEIGGNSSSLPDVEVSIIFDPDGANQVLLSTRGDTVQETKMVLTGNGTKKLRISLTNNTSSTKTIGGYYIGELG